MMTCRSLAEMPVRRVEISKMARNHILSGLRVLSRTVPEVRLVAAFGALEQPAAACRPHPRRATLCARRRATPARLHPVGAAVLLGGEPRLELGRGLREVPPHIIRRLRLVS
jgi:hypothetical protein